jgi:hypothetical protein
VKSKKVKFSTFNFIKLSGWGPISLLIQVFLSYIALNMLKLSEIYSFTIAIIFTIQINYLVASVYIFKQPINFKTYILFLSSSGLSRLIELIIFSLFWFEIEYNFKVIICSLFGVFARYLLYENFVFNDLFKNVK